MVAAMSVLAAYQVWWLASGEGSVSGRLFVAVVVLLLGYGIFDGLLEMMKWVFAKEDTDAEFYESKDGGYVVRLIGHLQIMVAVEHIPDEWGHGAGVTAVYIQETPSADDDGGRVKETGDVKHSGLKTELAAEGGV